MIIIVMLSVAKEDTIQVCAYPPVVFFADERYGAWRIV